MSWVGIIHTVPIIGFLDRVQSTKRLPLPNTDSIIITWEPPFSLNLTDVEPDVVYCVDMYNVTAHQSSDHIILSDCNVVEPQYTFTSSQPDPTDLFEFIITPRSNTEGATNGTQSESLKAYFYGK